MKSLKNIFTVVVVVTLLASCKKDQYYIFNDVARIQFGPTPDRILTTSYDFADTMKPYTFFYEPSSVQQDTVFFDIYAIGGFTNTDRPYKLVQEEIPGANNAVPGVHYKAFDDPSVKNAYVIKAGEVHARVPIVLLRDASLKDMAVKLKFVVAENDAFSLGERTKLWRRVEFTDGLSQPAAWNASGVQYYWGKYSKVKHQFMIDNSGEKWDQDFISFVMTDFNLLTYWRLQLRVYLTDYNNAHPGNPLRDEDGELVIFP